jgi:hypothetical protein
MYKVGDKLLCIKSTNYGHAFYDVKINNIYTITDVKVYHENDDDDYSVYYKIDGQRSDFGSESKYARNFISLKEYRKQKLKKLNDIK